MELAPLAAVIAFVLGACVGSFLNVVIYRVPRGLSIAKPARSFCPGCEKTIAARHNVPLVSWLALNGRCAGCGGAIPVRYFVVELVTALLFALLALMQLDGVRVLDAPVMSALLLHLVLAALTVAIATIDFQCALIPDPLSVPWMPLLAAGVAFAPRALLGQALVPTDGAASPFALALAGLFAGALPALLADFLRREREVIPPDQALQSALPEADEEFSLVQEMKAMALPLLLPAAAGAVAAVLLLRGHDFRGEPALAALLGSCAGGGAGLALVFAVRAAFSALFRREAMGLGDAKFLGCAGTLLGAEGVAIVFLLSCGLGALPAFGGLLAKIPAATCALLAAALLPLFALEHVARALSPAVALLVVMPIPLIALLLFLRRLRRGDVELRAMPFGPFLAVASLLMQLWFAPIAGALARLLPL